MRLLRLFWQRLRYLVTGALLCDTCRYDYGDACRRPERPNAKTCPDYRRGRD
jgi:hypothetical protein